jgi:hypothetical protein
MVSGDRNPPNLTCHTRILGMSWIVYGILRLVAAFWLALFSETATVMFGSLLNRVPDPFRMMTAFHFLYASWITVSAICGSLGILAGLSLLFGSRSGERLAVIAAFLSLASIPLGTTLGIYTLILLLNSASSSGVTQKQLE